MDKDDKIIRPSRRKTADGKHSKMKPAARKTNDVDLLDENEQERILEAISISVPRAPLPKMAKPIWGRFLGAKVLLLLRDGIEIEGILLEIAWDFVRLDNMLEVGPDFRRSGPWVMIDTSDVKRIYPANTDYEHNG